MAEWLARRRRLSDLHFEIEVRDLEARAALSAYKVKSDLEWNAAFASRMRGTWKDDWLILLWSVPLIILIVFVTVPPLREYILADGELGELLHGSTVTWYAAGWAAIFAAVFGVRELSRRYLPDSLTSLVNNEAAQPDAIPGDVIADIHETLGDAPASVNEKEHTE